MEKKITDVYAAADIGGTSVKLGLFSEKTELLKKWEIRTDRSQGGKNILPSLCSSLISTAGSLHIKGLGIGVPGAVNERSEVHGCVNLGWGYTDLRAEVKRLMPDTERLAFANDATAAALGELYFGAGKGYDSVYLMTLGTGVGGGFALRGRVINGAHGAAGEIGHIKINPFETVKCSCGGRGCLEQYASAEGLVRLAQNILALKEKGRQSRHRETLHIERLFNTDIPSDASPLEGMQSFSSRDICGLAKEGDPLCGCIMQLWGRCMGLAMSSIACSVDPRVFILGGGMSAAGELLTDCIAPYFREYAYPDCADTGILLADLGNDAGIYGCAALVSEGTI